MRFRFRSDLDAVWKAMAMAWMMVIDGGDVNGDMSDVNQMSMAAYVELATNLQIPTYVGSCRQGGTDICYFTYFTYEYTYL